MSSTLSTLEVLQKARELISDPKRWTKAVLSKDENGNSVLPNDECAVCFCSVGAIYRIAGMPDSPWQNLEPVIVLANHVEPKRQYEGAYESSVGRFNDDHSHAEVLAAFDAAISKATAEGETA